MWRVVFVVLIWLMLAVNVRASEPKNIALLDGFYQWHSEITTGFLERSGLTFTFYELDFQGEYTWQAVLERELAEARANGEKIIIIEVCLVDHHSGIENQLKMLSEVGATIVLASCWAGDTIHPAYTQYGIVIGAFDNIGRKLDYLNNGPEVDEYLWACGIFKRCTSSEAIIRYGMKLCRD